MGKKAYIRPELTAVSFKAERGYAASGVLSIFSSGIDEYEERSGWGNNGSNGFFTNDASTGVEQYGSRSGWGNDSDNGFF